MKTELNLPAGITLTSPAVWYTLTREEFLRLITAPDDVADLRKNLAALQELLVLGGTLLCYIGDGTSGHECMLIYEWAAAAVGFGGIALIFRGESWPDSAKVPGDNGIVVCDFALSHTLVKRVIAPAINRRIHDLAD